MSAPSQGLVSAGIDWRSAGLGCVGRLHERHRSAVRGNAPEPAVPAVIVATCHRVEIHAEGITGAAARALLARWCGFDRVADLAHVARPEVRRGREAARHLFRVAAGLESVVPGEDQVLAQLREAYRRAASRGAIGPALHRAFHAAFRAGRRVRGETGLGRGGRSLAGQAINELQRRAGGLAGRTALVIGAGRTAGLLALRLAQRGAAPLLIANRTASRAGELAARVGGRAIPWPWRAGMLASADIVASATGAAGPVVTAGQLERSRALAGRPRLVVDLGMPPDIECPPGEDWRGRYLGLADLATSLAGDRARRRRSIARAEQIVEEELDAWLAWCARRACRRKAQVT